ncbi:MAG: hypothetical protein ACFFD2_23790 [Promethearchaeota archaeon]
MSINSKPRPNSKRYCTPNCQFFKCSKRALGQKKKVGGRIRISCNFVDGDLCTGSRCTYSFCQKHKLKADGTCGLEERSGLRPADDEIEEKYEKELIQKDQQADKYQSFLKEKYRRKLNSKNKKW